MAIVVMAAARSATSRTISGIAPVCAMAAAASSAVARPAAPDLDAGDPVTLGAQYRALRSRFPQLTILGGCCGTDHRHVEQICFACAEEEREVAGKSQISVGAAQGPHMTDAVEKVAADDL